MNGLGQPIEAFAAWAHLKRNHVDGPLLTWAGHLHWLTWRERIALRFGWTTIHKIAAWHWPQYREWHLGIPEPEKETTDV